MKTYTLTRREEFCASHQLPEYEGNCAQLHGHNFTIEIEVMARELNEQGMVIDFRVLKDVLKKILPDHKHLNDWMVAPPTTENLAHEIFQRLRWMNIPVSAVTVWENPRNSVRYSETPQFQ